jgi:hypothetical protein
MVSEGRVRLTMIQTDPKAHFHRQEGIIRRLKTFPYNALSFGHKIQMIINNINNNIRRNKILL